MTPETYIEQERRRLDRYRLIGKVCTWLFLVLCVLGICAVIFDWPTPW